MDAKLTLSLDESVIRKAKEFAKKNNTSLSRLFENYITNLTRKEKGNTDEISTIVKSLSGVLTLPDDFNHKKERERYLESKYK